VEVVASLCSRGAAPNAVTHDGATPLHWASLKGSYECVKYLLEKTSASPLLATLDGFTALHYTCTSSSANESHSREGGKIHIARLLLCDYGASVDAVNEDGDTPLHFASFLGNHLLMRFLLTSGEADTSARDKVPLLSHPLLFLAPPSPDHTHQSGFTPLHLSAARGHTKCVQLLLATPSRSSLSTGQPSAASPLLSSEQLIAVSLLFELDDQSRSPLHLACQHNHPDSVTVLLQFLSAQPPPPPSAPSPALLCSEYLHCHDRVSRLSLPPSPLTFIGAGWAHVPPSRRRSEQSPGPAAPPLRVQAVDLCGCPRSGPSLFLLGPLTASSLRKVTPRSMSRSREDTWRPLLFSSRHSRLTNSPRTLSVVPSSPSPSSSSHPGGRREESRRSTSPALLASAASSSTWSSQRSRSTRGLSQDSLRSISPAHEAIARSLPPQLSLTLQQIVQYLLQQEGVDREDTGDV
jgi:ankyrin repeat protein